MSRYCFSNPADLTQTVSFGWDHALGYFYDICDSDDEVIEEKCSRFDHLSGVDLHNRLMQLLGENADNHERFTRQLKSMLMDVEF
jgi:hypothetical protein